MVANILILLATILIVAGLMGIFGFWPVALILAGLVLAFVVYIIKSIP